MQKEAIMSRLEVADRIALGLLVVAVILGCSSPFALGALREGDTPQAQAPMRLFARLDRNHDGRLSAREASRVPGIAAVFHRADADGDGRLSPAEFQNAQGLLIAGDPQHSNFMPVAAHGALRADQYLPALDL